MNTISQSPQELASLAQQALSEGRRLMAIEALRALLIKNPDLGDAWGRVAALAERAGDSFAAAAAQSRFVEARPEDDDRRMKLARMLSAAGRLDEGLTIAKALADKHKTSAPAAFRAGNLAFFKGETDYAADMFKRALKYDPDDVESWCQLVKLESFPPGSDGHTAMIAMRDRLEAKGDTKNFMNACIALADACHAAKAYDEAYEHYARGKGAMAAERPYNVADERAYVKRHIMLFNETFFERIAAGEGGHPSNRPIFVMGMPRSGTTLLEQLLTTHSEVIDGGELEAIHLTGSVLGRYERAALEEFQTRFDTPEGGPFRRFGQVYLNFMADEFGAEGRVLDKALDLPMYAGPALAAFPNASFIWIRRDPRDVALSVFKTRLLVRHDWSWTWEGIAERLVQVEAIQRHFLSLFPERILFIPYETFVNSPAEWSARLQSHCGLQDEGVHERFHENDRAVKTASKTQVRQPISNKSVGAWRRYEPHMQEFIDAYERLRPAEWGEPYQAP